MGEEAGAPPVGLEQGEPQVGPGKGERDARDAGARPHIDDPGTLADGGGIEKAERLGDVALPRVLGCHGGEVDPLVPPVQLVEEALQTPAGLSADPG